MMRSEKKAANAMGGKTARACDGCLRKRARWYCVADDAFLCQACDASVHSANQLASRHERVRLEGASFSSKFNEYNNKDSAAAPFWHQGFTRKARTPRPNNNKATVVTCSNSNDQSLVPEIGSEEGSLQDEVVTEEQLLYQVPVFDPCDLDDLHGFLPLDMDLGKFAADVESLLGNGLDEDSCDVKELGLLDCKEEKMALKVKDEVVEGVAATREALIDWNFDEVPEMKRNISLKLNYDAVITAWASQGCPWTTGSRPDFNPNEYCWPDCTGSCCQNVHHHPLGGGVLGCHMGGGSDGGREARVSRYREKRRTRLFSKKIRYEVRKLNAEKRPRMKGRFVKRTSFVGANAFSLTQ